MGQLEEQPVETPAATRLIAENSAAANQIEILAKLDEIKKQEDTKRMDVWDKFGILGPFFSGLILALVGILINRTISHNQLEVQQREVASKYVQSIEAADSNSRVKLMNILDLVVDPDHAVQIAIRYAYPNANSADHRVADAAVGVLQRCRETAKQSLEKISKSPSILEYFPEKQIAGALIRSSESASPTDAFIRISGMDDFADVKKGEKDILPIKEETDPLTKKVKLRNHQLMFAEDSGWNRLNEHLDLNKENDIEVYVFNNGAGPCGVRVELSAGIQQIDYNVRYSYCPSGQALRIRLLLEVDDKGGITLIAPEVAAKPGMWSTCYEGCAIPVQALD